MVKIYKQPFAHWGDAIAIPDASQPDGKVSSADGWTPDYQLPKTDPNYKPVGRQEMNGVFKEVTEALGQMQQFGFAAWQPVDDGWPVGANVNHGGGVWQSLANANAEEPGTGVLWKELLFGNLVPASETIQGLVRIATTAEAQALTDDETALTPAKLAAVLGGGSFAGSSKFARFPIVVGGVRKLVLMQWGSSSGTGSSVTFPMAFSGPSIGLTCTPTSSEGPDATYVHGVEAANVSATGFSPYTYRIPMAGGAVTPVPHVCSWLAIGE